jgi:pimeloyl-ACP methyl ester carboxylesterase
MVAAGLILTILGCRNFPHRLVEANAMQERVIEGNGVRIATQAFGDPSDPPIILIMGAMASLLWWPDGFVEGLARSGRYVIRYDNRDTGLSTTYPPGKADYSGTDMANDCVSVMDGYGFKSAHLAGMSAGGMIAQQVALNHPERIKSLILISSTPVGAEGLPSMTEEYAAHAGEPVDWSDRTSILNFMIRDARMLGSTRHPHDARAARDLIQRDLARSPSFASATNHFSISDGNDADHKLVAADIKVSTLVIHGTSDPLFPIAHGEALASAVKGATLVRIEGGGHELHEADWPEIIGAIIRHTDGQ